MFGWPEKLAHRHLLTHEPFEIIGFEVGGEHLDRHRAVERALGAAIHHTEPAAADLLGISKPAATNPPGSRR